jgi:hypothetical protein
MKTKNLSVALVLSLASAAAFAGNPAWPSAHPDEDTPAAATHSAMHVEQGPAVEAVYAAYGVEQVPGRAPAAGVLTRAQVKEELARARASGALDGGVLAYGAPASAHGGNAPTDLAAGHGAQRSN